MPKATIEIADELIEERLMLALSRNDVLSYQELKTCVAGAADDCTVRRALNELIACGLVTRKADRRALWYFGYAKIPAAEQPTTLDDVPEPFAKLLRQLPW
jgi:predicted transcriptional regulator